MDISKSSLKLAAGYADRARRLADAGESARAVVMVVTCLAWCVYRAPARSLPLFEAEHRRAA